MASNPLAWTVSKFIGLLGPNEDVSFSAVAEQFPAGTKFYNVGPIPLGSMLKSGGGEPRIEGTVIPIEIGKVKMEAVIPAGDAAISLPSEVGNEGAQTLESWMATELLMQQRQQAAGLVSKDAAQAVTLPVKPFDSFGLVVAAILIILVIL